MPWGKSSGEPKPFIHLLLFCGWDVPAEDCSFVFGPTHANHATLVGSRTPSAYSSSVKPMVLSHPLSLLFVVASSRQENDSFSHWGQAGLEPAFPIHRVVTIGYCPHLHLHYTINLRGCQGVFEDFLRSYFRREPWAGCFTSVALKSNLSPPDNYSIAQTNPKVNTFLKVIFLTMPGRLVLTNCKKQLCGLTTHKPIRHAQLSIWVS